MTRIALALLLALALCGQTIPLATGAGGGCVGPDGYGHPCETSEQITVLKLQVEIYQYQSLANFCELWAEKYRIAQWLPQKQWEEFQKSAPRTIGGSGETYEEHYRQQAREYRAKGDAAMAKLKELASKKCREQSARINENGEISCVSF